MVVEVLNMFKNELSCTATRDCLGPLVHIGTVSRNNREDFIFIKIITATEKYINYLSVLVQFGKRKQV